MELATGLYTNQCYVSLMGLSHTCIHSAVMIFIRQHKLHVGVSLYQICAQSFNDNAMLHCSSKVPFMLMKLPKYAQKCD